MTNIFHYIGFAGFDELDLSSIDREHIESFYPQRTSPRCSSPVVDAVFSDSVFTPPNDVVPETQTGSICSFRDSGFGDMDSLIQSSLGDTVENIHEVPRPSETLPQFNVEDSNWEERDDPTSSEAFESTDISSGRQARIDEMKTMNKRVSDWHHSLRAILQESQARNCFDIHEFGTHIIELVKSRGASSTFEDVLTGRHPSSIANYFLSMLQLVSKIHLFCINIETLFIYVPYPTQVNVGNIGISVPAEKTTQICLPSDIHLTLLSEIRHSSEIDNNMLAN